MTMPNLRDLIAKEADCSAPEALEETRELTPVLVGGDAIARATLQDVLAQAAASGATWNIGQTFSPTGAGAELPRRSALPDVRRKRTHNMSSERKGDRLRKEELERSVASWPAD